MKIYCDNYLFFQSFNDIYSNDIYQTNFDRVTKERYVSMKNGNKCINYYESNNNVIEVYATEITVKEKSFSNFSPIMFFSGEHLQERMADIDIVTNTGIKLKKSNIDLSQVYLCINDKYYGVCSLEDKVTFKCIAGTDYIELATQPNTYYVTPNSKVRKERLEEVNSLKARYTLEHALQPKKLEINPWSRRLHLKDIPTKWKVYLEKYEEAQLAFISKSPRTDINVAQINKYLNQEYLKVVIQNPVEYFYESPRST